MKANLLLRQEVEVFYILPAIRREMAFAMKRSGMKQKDIAKKLFVQESTISQYMKDKRAAIVMLPEDVKKEIANSVKKITNRSTLLEEMQLILDLTHKDKKLCTGHIPDFWKKQNDANTN